MLRLTWLLSVLKREIIAIRNLIILVSFQEFLSFANLVSLIEIRPCTRLMNKRYESPQTSKMNIVIQITGIRGFKFHVYSETFSFYSPDWGLPSSGNPQSKTKIKVAMINEFPIVYKSALPKNWRTKCMCSFRSAVSIISDFQKYRPIKIQKVVLL